MGLLKTSSWSWKGREVSVMFKALLKKQFLYLLNGIIQDKKAGKQRSKLGLAGFALLFLFLFASVFAMFMGLSAGICDAFVDAGLTWLYFALAGLTGLVAAVIGSAFMSYSALFQADDNDLLMSMPVPSWAILFTRMLTVWLMGFLFELLAIAASFVIYGTRVGFSARAALTAVLLILFTSFLALALSTLLGWLVALLMSKVTNKSAITVLFILVFLGGYYSVYFRIQSILQEIIAAGESIGSVIRTWVYPVYQFGLAGAGNTAALVKYCLICTAALALVYWIVSKNFIKIATANKGTVKKEYKAVPLKAESLKKSLLHKELRHFVNSPAYMLNAGLGIIAMPALAVMLLIKKDVILGTLQGLLASTSAGGFLAVAFLSVICFTTTLNDITAPAISIEGKTLWIIKSMPVDYQDFLAAKIRMHLLLTCIPVLPLIIAGAYVLSFNVLTAVMVCAGAMTFIYFMACLGLFLNLKMPRLDWQNETSAVKSSMSALICIFGGWVLAALPALAAFLAGNFGFDIAVPIQLAVWLAAFAIGAVLLNKAIKKQGPAILQSL